MSKTAPTKYTRIAKPASTCFILGRERFARISAVEGIALTEAMRADMERFDRQGLSAAERRRAILARFTPGT